MGRLIFSLALALFLAQPLPAGDPPVRPSNDPKVDRDRLVGIEDGTRLPGYDDNPHEFQSYCYLLVYARNVAEDAMQKAARKDVTYVHLAEQPSRYRGALVHIRGRLKQLLKFDAPRYVLNDGVKDLYEAWIVQEGSRSRLYCVIFTELPPGLELGEKLDKPVECDGYFFKLYYAPGLQIEGKPRSAPLLVTRTLRLPAAAQTDEEASRSSHLEFLLMAGGAICGLIAMVVGLHLWFRRGDRMVNARLARNRTFNLPTEETPPAAGGTVAPADLFASLASGEASNNGSDTLPLSKPESAATPTPPQEPKTDG